MVKSDSDTTTGLAFNTTRKPWNDVRVRQAFAYALDRTAIITSVYNTLGRSTKSPIAPVLWTYSKSAYANAFDALPSYNPDLAKAQELIAAAHAKGTVATLTIGSDTDLRVALFVEEAAGQLGITLTLRQLPPARKAAMESTNGPKDFDLDLVAARSDTPDPLNMLLRAFNPANAVADVTMYGRTRPSRAPCSRRRAPRTRRTRPRITIKAQAQIMQDVPVIPYVAPDTHRASQQAADRVRPDVLHLLDALGRRPLRDPLKRRGDLGSALVKRGRDPSMVARVASFEGVDFAEAEKTLDQAEAIGRPLIGALAGYQGNYELVAANGKVLSITLFDTAENAAAAERTFDEELPRQLGHLFTGWAGRRVSVDLYNVVSSDTR